jgi:UPF0755 protein
MRGNLSSAIQRTITWLVPALLLFAITFAISETHGEKVVVTDPELANEALLVDLYERGYFANAFSYNVARVAVALGVDIGPGAYTLKKGMGPFSFLAAAIAPEYKYVTVEEGLRREQVAESVAKQLKWTDDEKVAFLNEKPLCSFSGGEGYFFPGVYLVAKDDTPEMLRVRMEQRLEEVMATLTNDETVEVLNVQQILTIASLIQREAAGKHDMKLISGVIWNRLFDEMPLQIDATLQYVKAEKDNSVWWPIVKPKDKSLDSPYNTYKNKGLPPGPIANPGLAAIEAALDPIDTTCLYYIHDRTRTIHCAETYEAHKRNISYYLK